MRKIKEDELMTVAVFMAEQFFEKEETQQMFKGINVDKAKRIAISLEKINLEFYFKYGDIFVYDDDITSAMVGINSKKLSLIKLLPYSLKQNKILSELTRDEIAILKENVNVINQVHGRKWYKKYCKNSYYLVQFAIDKNKRGKGIARQMIEFLFSYVGKQNANIVLETFTSSNVPIYEHFGFELKDELESKNKELKEYRMIKKLNNNELIKFGLINEKDAEQVENIVEKIDD